MRWAKILLLMMWVCSCPLLARADSEERIRDLIRERRFQQALTEIGPDDKILRFVCLWGLSRLDEANTVLLEINSRALAERPSFDRVQFYLTRGALEGSLDREDLEIKNYREAVRQSDTVDLRVVAKMRLAMAHGFRRRDDDLAAAKKLLGQAANELSQAQHPATLVRFLWYQARFLQNEGQIEHIPSLYLAAMAHCRVHALPMLESSCQAALAWHFKEIGQTERALSEQGVAIRITLGEREWDRAIGQLLTLSYLDSQTLASRDFYKEELRHAIKVTDSNLHRAKLYALLSAADTKEAIKWAQDGLDKCGGEGRTILLRALARAKRKSASTEELLSLYQQAEESARPRSFDMDTTLDDSLGNVRFELAQLYTREKHLPEALEIIKDTIQVEQAPGRRWYLCRAYNTGLSLSLKLGDMARARQFFRGVVEEVEQSVNPTYRSVLLANLLFGLVYNTDEGVTADPASILDGPSALAQKLLAGELKNEATYSLLSEVLDEALAAAKRKSEQREASYVQMYRGTLFELTGRAVEAENAYRMALEYGKDGERGDTFAIQMALARLAFMEGGWTAAQRELESSLPLLSDSINRRHYYQLLGYSELGLERFQEALEYFKKAEGKNEMDTDLALGKIRAQIGLKRYEEALATISQAVAHPATTSSGQLLLAKGDILRILGQSKESREVYRRAIAELAKDSRWNSLPAVYASLVESLLESSQTSAAKEEALSIARTLLDKAELVSVRSGDKPALAKLLRLAITALMEKKQASEAARLLRQSRRWLGDNTWKAEGAALWPEELATLETLSQPQLGRIVARTRQEFLLLQERLRKQKSFDLGGFVPARLLALSEKLPEESCILVLQCFPEATYITTLSQQDVASVKLGVGASELVSKTRSLGTHLRSPEGTPDRLQRSLFELLIQPVMPNLVEKERVFLVLDEELRSAPIGVLKDSAGEMLIGQHRLSLLSPTISGESRPLSFGDDTEILLVGAPTGQSLRGVQTELRSLVEQFHNSTLLKGADATSTRVSELVGAHRLVHVASHASKDGIELEDGFASLREVFSSRLQPGTLVVLSACETALSDGGASSLAEAYRAAGAQAVVASLWRVDDAATAEFFESFYQYLRRGESPDSALQQAKRRMQASRWSHPYYWAGFVLLGTP